MPGLDSLECWAAEFLEAWQEAFRVSVLAYLWVVWASSAWALTLGLTGKLGITGRAGLIGGLLALPGIFKGLAGLARGDDPAPTFLNQQNTAAVYGMDANNLNTQNLTLALHYRR
ncbi:MAG: hypothetical protein GTN93_06070 [Anaerolineae bacterium]|nr:hypothetical protein [Anaerolineae bacterium]